MPFDEPLSTDWNGNELLLSDILGTESDLVMRPMEEDADRQLLADALEKLTQREREIITPPVWAGRPPGSIPRRRWRIEWESRNPISPGWKSASSAA